MTTAATTGELLSLPRSQQGDTPSEAESTGCVPPLELSSRRVMVALSPSGLKASLVFKASQDMAWI